jgi:hypothetical protein
MALPLSGNISVFGRAWDSRAPLNKQQTTTTIKKKKKKKKILAAFGQPISIRKEKRSCAILIGANRGLAAPSEFAITIDNGQ